ncbi:neuronal acetylcholine receptor subunit alpha-10-like [Babylonia areolata]|uniref:neuronal acetylcholine receptor subunit alpha-10-like n=1 Tax=Babylonia areolata TaxID=304850 RepID=UPI003FD13473
MAVQDAGCSFLVFFIFLAASAFWMDCQLVSAHPHAHDVEVHLDHESHVLLHVLDEHHYVRHLRPAASVNDSVVVDVDMALVALHGLDTSTGFLETTLRLFMKWEDPRLQWNSTENGGVTEIPVPVSKIWTPDLNLFSSSPGSYTLLTGKNAILHHGGVVTWLCDVRLPSQCSVDLSKFPFDSHACLLELGQGHPGLDDSIHLHVSQSPPGSAMDSAKGHVDTSSLSGEWKLLTNEIRVAASNHGVEVRVEVGRRSQLHQCLTVAPVALVALVMPCVFLLPPDSGAKITLGGLMQVSMCMCLRTLYDVVQGTHGPVPNIVIFGVVSLALTSISIVMAAIVMSLSSRGYATKPVPACVSAVFLGRCGLRRWLCLDPYPSSGERRRPPFASHRAGNDNTEADADVTSLKDGDSIGEAKGDTGRSGREGASRGADRGTWDCSERDWREVARVLDRALLLLFLVLFVLLCISLLS